jgi:hypothetical protein
MKVLKSISAIILAVITLMSSTSFMVGFHYCGGRVQNVALFDKAEPCAMEANVAPGKILPLSACERMKSDLAYRQAGCCKDDAVIHDGDEFNATHTSIDITPAFVVEMAQPAVILSEVISSEAFLRPAYYNYDPPLRAPDLTVALQVFLI